MRLIVLLTVAALLSACDRGGPAPVTRDSSGEQIAPEVPTQISARVSAEYACEDGRRFKVEFQDQRIVVQFDGADERALPQAETGSGFLYRDPPYALRGDGNQAQWSDASGNAVDCQVVRSEP